MALFVVFAIFLIWLFYQIFTLKKIKWSTVNVITGGVKTGKSTLALFYAIKLYKVQVLKYNIRKFFIFLINHIFLIKSKNILSYGDRPEFYSNIPVDIKQGYTPLTTDILMRKEIPIEKSIVYIGEFSLVANSMDFKDMLLNEQTMLFFKLAGHSFNGKIFVDTQNIEDCHYNLKRCCDRYIYIHHSNTWLPFVVTMKLREMYYSPENQSAVNVFNEDLEHTLKSVIIFKHIWKKFDYRCYRVLNGEKDKQRYRNNIKFTKKDRKKGYLQANKIVSFRQFLTIDSDIIDKGGYNKK